MKNKKFLIIGAIVLLLVVGGVFAMKMTSKKPATDQTTQKKKTVLEPKNILEFALRPYIKLTPTADGHNLEIAIVDVKKPATEVEYELEYQSGTLLQGFQEVIKLDSLPAKTTKLFGSKSAGGAVTYHEDIKGGSLQARFIGQENYVLKQDWRYFDNKDKATEFSSKDAKFQITSLDLKTNRLLIVYNTPGIPAGLDKTPVSDPYSLTSATTLKGEGTVSIRANEEGELAIWGFDGTKWTNLGGQVDGKLVTVNKAPLMELYIVAR